MANLRTRAFVRRSIVRIIIHIIHISIGSIHVHEYIAACGTCEMSVLTVRSTEPQKRHQQYILSICIGKYTTSCKLAGGVEPARNVLRFCRTALRSLVVEGGVTSSDPMLILNTSTHTITAYSTYYVHIYYTCHIFLIAHTLVR